MAKKTNSKGAEPVAGPAKVAETQQESKAAPAKGGGSNSVTTTDGYVMDSFRVFEDKKKAKVQAFYGRLNPKGATSDEKRAGMRKLLSRNLTPEQAKEYARLSKVDQHKANEYLAKAAYPMHYDGKAFHNEKGVVNGKPVDYVKIMKLTVASLAVGDIITGRLKVDGITAEDLKSGAKTEKDVEALGLKAEQLSERSRGLVGKWQLSFGQKDVEGTRKVVILEPVEISSIKQRALVTLSDDGKEIASVGVPMSKLDVADMAAKRVALRDARHAEFEQHKSELLDKAKSVDWSRFYKPEGVEKLNYVPLKDNPDRVILKGVVNGIQVSALLNETQSAALRNGLATFEQVAGANNSFRNKVMSMNSLTAAAVTEDAAVKVIVARASDKNAKAFTEEQVKVLTDYVGETNDPEERDALFTELFDKARPFLDGVNAKWVEKTGEELHDLAHGVLHSEQQSKGLGM